MKHRPGVTEVFKGGEGDHKVLLGLENPGTLRNRREKVSQKELDM